MKLSVSCSKLQMRYIGATSTNIYVLPRENTLYSLPREPTGPAEYSDRQAMTGYRRIGLSLACAPAC